MKHYIETIVVLAVFIVISACNKATLIGSDILPSEDNINTAFTDTLSLTASTVTDDSLRVYHPTTSLQPTQYFLGRNNDPVFGVSMADIYTQLAILTTEPDFSDVEVDSVVLTLEYSTAGHYGDFTKPFGLSVFELNEAMDNGEIYYADQTFQYGEKLGELTNFTPMPYDSVAINDSTKLMPHLRIPLSVALGQRLLDTLNNSAYQDDVTFAEFFKGIALIGDDQNEALLAFNLIGDFSKLSVYYTQGDTINKTYDYVIKSQSAKTTNIIHDYEMPTTAPVFPFFDNKTLGDSLVFLQSMIGLNVKVDVPYIESLGNIIVNKAELILRVADTSDLTSFPLSEQLILTEQDDDGNLVLIEDIAVSVDRTNSVSSLFGGIILEEDKEYYYKLNMTGHFQQIVEGRSDKTLYITTFPKASQASRVILGGPKHSKYPMQLNLTYTKLD